MLAMNIPPGRRAMISRTVVTVLYKSIRCRLDHIKTSKRQRTRDDLTVVKVFLAMELYYTDLPSPKRL